MSTDNEILGNGKQMHNLCNIKQNKESWKGAAQTRRSHQEASCSAGEHSRKAQELETSSISEGQGGTKSRQMGGWAKSLPEKLLDSPVTTHSSPLDEFQSFISARAWSRAPTPL